MNVKFRMPKLWGPAKSNNTFKELALSILATTISIILTFGTAAVLDRRQQQKNRRQIALMVISDIYSFAQQIEDLDSLCISPWKKDLLELTTLSRDSIVMLNNDARQKYWNALGQGVMLPRDKTAENLFSSDISIWRDVSNFRFIKVVGNTYSMMADLEKNFKKQIDTKTSNYLLFINRYDVDEIPDSLQLVTFLEMREVKNFMNDYTQSFQQYFRGQAAIFYNAATYCCELMEISHEELLEFMNNNIE